MKMIKAIERNTMDREGLSSLAVLSVHSEIAVDPQNVSDIMATKSRRLFLV